MMDQRFGFWERISERERKRMRKKERRKKELRKRVRGKVKLRSNGIPLHLHLIFYSLPLLLSYLTHTSLSFHFFKMDQLKRMS